MNRMMLTATLAAAGLTVLSACSEPTGDAAEIAAEDTTDETLAALIGGADDLSMTSEALSDAGLQSIFDGNTPYTLFAPTDAAFQGLDLPLEGEEARAARVAILREHIVPGYLTMDDIRSALEQAGGSVEMQTMGSGTLTFSGEDESVTVTASDGSEAMLAGDPMSGANGSVFPIDAVLKNVSGEG